MKAWSGPAAGDEPAGASSRWGSRGWALIWLWPAVALTLGGCAAVGPDYRAPVPKTPVAWTEGAPGVSAGGALELARWWRVFRDPVLDSLMEKAAAANLDLRMAKSRVREARARRASVAAGEWPGVNAKGTVQRARSNTPPAPPGGVVGSLYQAGFDAGWELDLFGRVRRAVEAADADTGAAVEDLRDVLVTLYGEVARNYVELRGLQRQLAVARANIGVQRQALEVTRARLKAGLTSEFDVTRAQAQLAASESQVPALEASLRRTQHRLAVLLGREPGALTKLLSAQAPIPTPPPDVRIGLPSTLLLRRPDVRRAERELAAATARIGVAEADLYPRFSLLGSFGIQAFRFQELADWSSRIWSIGPSVRWPVFDAGRIRANVRVREARQEQALLRYQKAILTAQEDVEDALVSYGREEARRRSLAAAAAADAQALDTANALYGAGLAEFLQVLDAQRSLFAAQSQLAQSEEATASDLVSLYKALGGGWTEDGELEPVAPPQSGGGGK